MDLLINTAAVAASSRGVRRYYASVMRYLDWPGRVEALDGAAGPAQRVRELLLRGREDAILWTPCQRGPLRAHNHVITVHDCINVEYVYRHDWRLPVYRRLMELILNGARQVVAISNATREALLRNYRVPENRVVVIRSGTDVIDAVQPRAASRAESSDGPFVMMVTNALPHKNNLAACLGFARSRAIANKVTLRVIGSLPSDARDACVRAGVRLEEHREISDEQLAQWYAQALFLLSPSLAEGHNLPIAEALSLGADVLCSDIPVHREFYAGEVRFFDPHGWESIAAAIDAALDTPRPWFAPSNLQTRRSFADVAADYRALFGSMA